MSGQVYVEVGDARATDPYPVGAWNVAKWDDSLAQWGGTTPSWSEVACRVRRISLAGGRGSALETFGPATAEVEIANADGFATWSPAAPGPLIPGAWLRVRADDAAIFTGTIRRVVDRYQPGARPGAVIVAADSLARLGGVEVMDAAAPWGAGQSAAQRIGALLDAIGWPPELRSLDPGGPALTAHFKGGNLLDIVQRVAVSAGGHLFADRDARVVYRGADWLRVDPRAKTPQATFANDGRPGALCATGMTPNGPDIERVINDVQLTGQDEATTPAGKAEVRRYDYQSYVRWGYQSWSTGPLYSVATADLDVLAGRVLGMRRQPAPRLDSLAFSPLTPHGADPWPFVAGVRYGDRVNTTYSDPEGWAWSFTSHVHAVGHEIEPSGVDRQAARWTTQLILDDATPWDAADPWDAGLWNQAKWAVPA